MSIPRRSLLLTAVALGLAAAAAAHADSDDYRVYYGVFDKGPARIPGDDTRWVPQGLTYWAERDALVISYYDAEKEELSRLAVVDRASGRKIQILELPESGHVGGLAMTKRSLWVTGSDQVTRYPKSGLLPSGAGVRGGVARLKSGRRWPVKASSFAMADGQSLWVGKYTTGHRPSSAYRYDVGRREVPGAVDERMAIPSNVQGMEIVAGRVIWSISGRGNTKASSLRVMPLRQALRGPIPPFPHGLEAPPGSEGLVYAYGKLYVLYESGARKFAGLGDDRIYSVHHAPADWVLSRR